jgi:rhodanese-related sulfurtransferase
MTLKKIITTLASGSLLLALLGSAHAGAPAVTLEDTRAALEKSSTVVVDIREANEQAAGVAKGALLIPMGQLEKRLGSITKSKDQALILICATQNRSSRLAEQLQAAGYTKVSYVQGGMNQWAARGWPVVKPAIATN